MTNLASVTIATPQLPLQSAKDALDLARTFEVRDEASAEFAGAMYSDAKAEWQRIDDKRKELKAPILEAGKVVDNFFRDALAYLSECAEIYNGKVSRFLQDERRRQQEAEAKAREEARREQERIAKEAAEKEAAARAEGLRLRAEAAEQDQAGNVAAAQAMEQQAAQAELEGHQQAQETLELAHAVVPLVIPDTAKPSNVSARETWQVEDVDLRILVESVAGGRRLNPGGKFAGADRRKTWAAPRSFVIADMDSLNRTARAQQSAMQIPGVRVAPKMGIARKAKR